VWRPMQLGQALDRVEVPVLLQEGWQDRFVDQMIEQYERLRRRGVDVGQAHPNARVDLADGPRLVKARAAAGAERSRLWAKWREVEPKLDGYAALRSSETAVVILEPRR
jgi:predicted acyl esterase